MRWRPALPFPQVCQCVSRISVDLDNRTDTLALSVARVELADAKSQLSSVTQKHESASQGTASVSKRLSELEAENKVIESRSQSTGC